MQLHSSDEELPGVGVARENIFAVMHLHLLAEFFFPLPCTACSSSQMVCSKHRPHARAVDCPGDTAAKHDGSGDMTANGPLALKKANDIIARFPSCAILTFSHRTLTWFSDSCLHSFSCSIHPSNSLVNDLSSMPGLPSASEPASFKISQENLRQFRCVLMARLR